MQEGVLVSGTAWTLVPIVLTIICVFLTKRILLALGVGIAASAFLLANFDLYGTFRITVDSFFDMFFAEGEMLGFLNMWNISILIFLFCLGIITSFVVLSGGTKALTASIVKRVKSRKGVQGITLIIGILLIIDDYFCAIVAGYAGRTLSKGFSVSRARMSYIVDSVSAPTCIAVPISSWATAIMGNIAVVYASVGVEGNVLLDFIRMVPYHFYVLAAVALVLITITFEFNIFSMKRYERDAIAGNDSSADEVEDETISSQASHGTVLDFVLPIVVLVFVTLGAMIVTGFVESSQEAFAEHGVVYAILDNLDLPLSLLIGGFSGVATTLLMTLRHLARGYVTKSQFGKALLAGLSSMVGANTILIFAWTVAGLIGNLGVGDFVAEILLGSGIPGSYIPFLMFVSAALMAFAIGTSWGTFGIVLPIAGAIAFAVDINLLLPTMSAVLSGAVFGDHASPISDTTVLASAGAGCKVLSHFESQLPYAMLAALLSCVGYLLFGISGGSLLVGYIGFIIAIAAVVVFARYRQKRSIAAPA